MPTPWKLTLAYDGTDFHGWQVQPGLPTIQGTLAEALVRITGEQVLPQGSGRTDAGVHALGQVVSFLLHSPIPAPNLMRALNRALPSAIRVLAAEIAPPDFHARYSATEKTYQYRIFPAGSGAICPPFLARTVYACPWPLNLAAMQQAAQAILGEHDFTSFAAVDPDLATRTRLQTGTDVPSTDNNVRTLYESSWSSHADESTAEANLCDFDPLQPDLLLYTVRGNGFLHHMVRNLVGTFLEIGRGRLQPAAMSAILAARNRALAGPTAPASGLFLLKVRYSDFCC